MKKLYKKFREPILYLIFGVLTTLVSIISFAIFCKGMGMDELLANLYSWLLSVLFAFITNRIWVFQAKKKTSVIGIFVQMLYFYGGRVVTLIIEEVILYVFVICMQMDSVKIKIVAQIVVIILNYVISKWVVFREKK